MSNSDTSSETNSETNSETSKVVVAGASGFVGSHLATAKETADGAGRLIGLTRDPTIAEGSRGGNAAGYDEWRVCDLFSRRDTLEALEDADLAVYLVHSGRPSARLTQGKTPDLDLICADNFARAARRNDLEHIVCVPGLLAEERDVPPQLVHRREVRETLAGSGVPVTSLRPSLILGPGGVSSDILIRLVRRLPAMALPQWTDIPTRPIAVDDLVDLIWTVLTEPRHFGGDYDVGGPDSLSFRQMLAETAELMDRRRPMFSLPFETPRLSTGWISFFSGVPFSMIRQLVEAFRTEVQPEDLELQEIVGQSPRGFREVMREAVDARERSGSRADLPVPIESDGENLPAKRGAGHVRSVQRLPRPGGHSARWVADAHAEFLPRLLWPFLRVREFEDRSLRILLQLLPWPLLELSFDSEVSTSDRQLYWVTGGILAAEQNRGRLEFREVLDGRWIIASLHEFQPALPWFIYRYTQALLHLWVMRRFGRWLGQQDDEADEADEIADEEQSSLPD